MRCLAFAGPALLSHLQLATAPDDLLHTARDWAALRSAVQQRPWDLIIIEAEQVPATAGREATFASSLIALRGGPFRTAGDPVTTHVAIYVALTAHSARISLEMAHAGAAHYVIADEDDPLDPVARWRSIMETTRSATIGTELVGRLGDVLSAMPERMRAAITTMCTVPGTITSLSELAQASVLTPRSVQRITRDAGLVSIRHFITAASLLHSWPALRNPLNSNGDAVRASGLSAYRANRVTAKFIGRSLAELRTAWPSNAEVLDAVESVLRAGTMVTR